MEIEHGCKDETDVAAARAAFASSLHCVGAGATLSGLGCMAVFLYDVLQAMLDDPAGAAVALTDIYKGIKFKAGRSDIQMGSGENDPPSTSTEKRRR